MSEDTLQWKHYTFSAPEEVESEQLMNSVLAQRKEGANTEQFPFNPSRRDVDGPGREPSPGHQGQNQISVKHGTLEEGKELLLLPRKLEV